MFFDLISLWSPGVSRTLVDACPTGDHDLYSRFLLECSFIRSILVICIINVIFLLLSVACVRMFFFNLSSPLVFESRFTLIVVAVTS